MKIKLHDASTVKLDHINITTLENNMDLRDLDALTRYIESRNKHGYSDEELFEMEASFGPDEEVVDIFTGKTIDLGRKAK
jgi:hypothetical protein